MKDAMNKNRKRKCSPPMSKYAKNMRPSNNAPSFFNYSFNLWTMPFVGTMTLLDSMPSSYLRSMPSNRSSSLVKFFSISTTVTSLSNSRLKVAAMGHSKNDCKCCKAPQCEISNGFLYFVERDLKYYLIYHSIARSLHI